MKSFRFIVVSFLMLAVSASLDAKVTLPEIISDNMVLQQQTDVALWGTAEPGKKVRVKASWGKSATVVRADSQTGRWKVTLRTPGAGGPYEITISDGEAVTLKNVLVGEVWFCSGQSNMEMPVKGYPSTPAEGGAQAIIGARASRPLRICNIPHASSVTVRDKAAGHWEENRPEVVANTSAAAYFFADALQTALDVPVGIIVSCWGGSSIQTWMKRDILAEKFPEVDLGATDGKHPVVSENQDACLLYNAMVAPLVPYTFKGMIWYQGETNREHPAQYTRLQTEYVAMMRELFNVPDAPFYFAQIAPFWYWEERECFFSGYFYEGQANSLKTIPHSGMVVTCDIGDKYNIHPFRKKELGRRFAMLALQHDYGCTSICSDAPTYKSVEFRDGKAYVTFDVDDLYLATLGNDIVGFEISGADRLFHEAAAKIDWDNYRRVIVSSPEVPEPVAVRYCFKNWCTGNLYNNFGIPAAPFRTDDWDDLYLRDWKQ